MARNQAVVLDCRRLLCPLPVIRVQDLVSRLAPGDEVTAACTDPGVLNDIPAWCRINGHEILDIRASETECFVVLRVGCRT